MTPGYITVQTVHSCADFADQFPSDFSEWKKATNSIICLGVKDETHLMSLYNTIKSKTNISLFYEPDVNANTSLCFYASTPELRGLTSNLPLIK